MDIRRLIVFGTNCGVIFGLLVAMILASMNEGFGIHITFNDYNEGFFEVGLLTVVLALNVVIFAEDFDRLIK